MGGKDKISVIVPCYNVQKYVMRCFESIHNQTYGFENLEVIFVDDLSADNTWSILELLQKKYPENVISVKLNKKDLAGGARNLGMDISSGKYITFVDADDWLHPEMIRVSHERMLCGNYDIIKCGYKNFLDHIDVEQDIYETYDYEDIELEDINKRKNLIIGLTGGGNVIVWRKLYSARFIKENKIKFPENVYFEDTMFSFLCAVLAKRICIINIALYFYYQNDQGIDHSNKGIEMINDLTKVMDLIRKEIKYRGLDNEIGRECRAEIQIFMFWQEYLEKVRRLEIIMDNEIKKSVNDELTKETDILDNPYVHSMIDPKILKRIDYLKE